MKDPDQRREWVTSTGDRFAERIGEIRANLYRSSNRHNAYTQGMVAAKMALLYGYATWNQSTLARVERGEREVKLGEAVALCEILEVDLMDVISPGDLRG